jgi:glycosyltransferase involved in cell wall biosynthesis
MAQPEVTVHVIVPARNEEDCIGRCLQSLAAQQGVDFRLTLVDDGSTDHTRMIAESVIGVEVMTAPDPEEGVSGKCNALIAAASGSQAKWLLFTDADTFHYPGSLAAAVKEAEERQVDLLSYSPEQEVVSLGERMLMPLVFADLVRVYPSERVNDPRDPVAAANGQYILVRREVYQAMGGHRPVSDKLLEDLELARIYKASDHKIWFRYGGGLVRTRMYRSFHALCHGWIKGLVILFRHPLALAAWHLFEFLAILLPIVGGAILLQQRPIAALSLLAFGLLFYLGQVLRTRRSNFPWADNLLSFLGLPVYMSLLWRSWLYSNRRGEVTWKGRTYRQFAPKAVADSSTLKGKPRLKS